jgi:hypothetical protein
MVNEKNMPSWDKLQEYCRTLEQVEFGQLFGKVNKIRCIYILLLLTDFMLNFTHA